MSRKLKLANTPSQSEHLIEHAQRVIWAWYVGVALKFFMFAKHAHF